jgi:DNA repair protein SbcC/Rad50
MIPLHLSLSGLLSYRDPVEIDFSPIDLACISGPNGAGKSSLLDAMTWALFGQARKRDDSLINNHSQTAEVSLIFSYEGNIYRVQRVLPRGKTSMLEFQILQDGQEISAANVSSDKVHLIETQEWTSAKAQWKPLTERTIRETQANIENTLRMDYETFVNASFFLQGKADQFTQQRPGDRKRILGSILGLEVWEEYRKRTVERRRAIEEQIAGLDGRLQEIATELDEETSA